MYRQDPYFTVSKIKEEIRKKKYTGKIVIKDTASSLWNLWTMEKVR